MAMERIKRRRDFVAAARALSSVMPGLVLQARDRGDDAAARVGFTATRKLGKAVLRNRIKRRLRAAAEAALRDSALAGYDYVIIGRSATAQRAFQDLQADLKRAAAQVHAASKARKPGIPRLEPSEAAKPKPGKQRRPAGDVERS
ncbi:ribonuclease P protein component [Rhodoligotrophos ferricapiens]|uniref:ribonuclease P protein component n=1 Tax=Rhodoligotrophos ferricapiens TaxID=3069264 RepID=UPI00315DB595